MKAVTKYLTVSMIMMFGYVHEVKAQRQPVTANYKIKNLKDMSDQSFTTEIIVSQSGGEVFEAVNNVRGWWSEEIEGSSDSLNAEFRYHYQDVHQCRLKIIEMTPGQRVVWLVQENTFSFTRDKKEWTGTKIIFDIAPAGNQTKLKFTHLGLVPEYECYSICYDAWTNYITSSLKKLIENGRGEPITKQGNDFQTAVEERIGE